MKAATLGIAVIVIGIGGGALSVVQGAGPRQQAAKPLVGDCAVVAGAPPSVQRLLHCQPRTPGG
jgi:hypothetical protein